MEEVETLTNTLQSMFNEIQRCDSKTYSANISKIIAIIKESNVLSDFIPILYSILMCKRQQIPNKIVLFLKRIFEESQGDFLTEIVQELVTLLDSKIVRVRKNALFLLKIITTVEGSVENDLLEKIAEKLFDKEKTVRKEAIIFLADHRDKMVHGNTQVSSLFKNLCRFDPCNEVRKLAFQNLQVTKQTYRCIIERCIDVNLSIRSIFFKKYLNKVAVRELDSNMRTFLFRRTYSERDFNAVEHFIEAIQEQYNFPVEFINLTEDFYSDKYEKIFKKLIFRLFDLYEFECTFKDIFDDQNISYYLLQYYYLTYTEENRGKDALILPNLGEITEFLYRKSKDLEDIRRIEKVRILFKIMRMYDVFDDDSRKIISNAVHRILKECLSEDIINESIGLLYSIDSVLSDKVFGSLIYKNIASNLDLSMLIAKNVMKNSKEIKEIQKAIISEIVMPNISHSISPMVLYYSLTIKYDKELMCRLEEFRETNENYLAMLVDLSIIHRKEEVINLALDVIRDCIYTESEESIVPISKLIMAELITDKSIIRKYISYSMKAYYSTASDKTQQYLNIFYHKYFSCEPLVLVSVFFFVYESLEANQKIFVDQTLYWLEVSDTRDALQQLYYNICLNLFIYHPNLKNTKAYINILNKIQIDEKWTSATTKKILFCCTQLLKKQENKKFMSEIVSKLVLVDDGEPISPQDLLEVKTDLLIG